MSHAVPITINGISMLAKNYLSVGLCGLMVAFSTSAASAAIFGNIIPQSSTTVYEGQSVQFYSQVKTDPGQHIEYFNAAYSISRPVGVWGGSSSFGSGHTYDLVNSPSMTVLFGDSGDITIRMDGFGQYGVGSPAGHGVLGSNGFSDNQLYTVLNRAPNLTSLFVSDYSVTTGQSFYFSANAFDPGFYDVLTYSWDLDGDGFFDDYAGQSGYHSYSTPGSRLVGVRVSDDDGDFSMPQFFGMNVSQAAPPAAATPEPASLILWGLGSLGCAVFSYRKRKRAAA